MIPPSRQLRSPVYALTHEREHNYYDDSDFYVIAFDWNTKTIFEHPTGSTRYAAGPSLGPSFVPVEHLPAEVLQVAREVAVVNEVLEIMRRHHLRVMTPGPEEVQKGTRVVLTRKARNRELGTLEAGLAGKVFWIGSHGRFYRNGYNRPNRHNTRLGVEFDDGRKGFVALDACRLDEPELPEIDAVEIAKRSVEHGNFRLTQNQPTA